MQNLKTDLEKNSVMIGARICYLRKREKMYQRELVAKIGVAKNVVWLWENGHYTPQKLHLIEIAKFFDVSVDWLTHGIGTEFDKYIEKPMELAPDEIINKEVLSKKVKNLYDTKFNLKQFRIERGLSQRKFAEILGFSRSYLGYVESGKKGFQFK